jgi:DNA-binding PadR family transcriptional regulator
MHASHALPDPRLEWLWHRMAGRGRRGHGPRGFGPGPWGGPPFGPGRGHRARRGDVRAAALVLLAEEPRNGYQVMQEIEQRSDGLWRPSPGSVYPALQQLEDEGLVRSDESAGRRLFHLTDEGRAYVEEHRDALGAPVGTAMAQIAFTGNDAQVQQARKVLADTRRALYRILAEDEPDPDPEP